MLEQLGVDSNNVHPLPNVILDDPYLALLSRNPQSAPGTPPQSAPDYVLNPLSIFRMARKEIPEGHAPESTVTQSASSLGTPSVQRSTSDELSPLMHHQSQELYTNNSVEDGFDQNLDMFFTPDPALLNWQPAEMVVGSGLDGDGLMPWIGASQMGEFIFEQHNS